MKQILSDLSLKIVQNPNMPYTLGIMLLLYTSQMLHVSEVVFLPTWIMYRHVLSFIFQKVFSYFFRTILLQCGLVFSCPQKTF